jgi:spore coat-associated protein N
MSGKLLKSAVVVIAATSFAVLGAAAGLADASRGRVQAKRPQLLIAGRNVQRARAVAPGDRIERTIVLRVRGRGELRVVALAIKAKRASLLTDRKQGLRLSLERCSRGWKRMLRAHSYTCRGRRTRLLARKPVLGRRRLGLRLRREQKAYLRLTLTLPTQAGNVLEGQTSTLVYRFTGVAQATR